MSYCLSKMNRECPTCRVCHRLRSQIFAGLRCTSEGSHRGYLGMEIRVSKWRDSAGREFSMSFVVGDCFSRYKAYMELRDARMAAA